LQSSIDEANQTINELTAFIASSEVKIAQLRASAASWLNASYDTLGNSEDDRNTSQARTNEANALQKQVDDAKAELDQAKKNLVIYTTQLDAYVKNTASAIANGKTEQQAADEAAALIANTPPSALWYQDPIKIGIAVLLVVGIGILIWKLAKR
jgi:hypothetical protein